MSDKAVFDRISANLDRFAELIKENAEQLRKDKAELDRRIAEGEKRQAEWEKRDAELSDKIANISQQVGGQANRIGEITEAMTISDNILDLVNKFEGIDVQCFAFNITKKYPAKDSKGNAIRKQHEVDGLAEGEKSVVIIEAKTSLTIDYVKYFIEKLAIFKLAYHYHADKDLYGAVTFIRADDKALSLAEEHGMFIIKASPPDVELANSQGFKPLKFV